MFAERIISRVCVRRTGLPVPRVPGNHHDIPFTCTEFSLLMNYRVPYRWRRCCVNGGQQWASPTDAGPSPRSGARWWGGGPRGAGPRGAGLAPWSH